MTRNRTIAEAAAELRGICAAKSKAPSGTYWRGAKLWARFVVRGREHRFSLETSDPNEASTRMDDQRRRLVDSAHFGVAGLTDGLSRSTWVRGRLVGFIYFAEAAGFIKIGYTKEWRSRLASIQTGNQRKLRILAVIAGSQKEEKALHQIFSHLRSRGEWFLSDPDLLRYIEAAKLIGRCPAEGG